MKRCVLYVFHVICVRLRQLLRLDFVLLWNKVLLAARHHLILLQRLCVSLTRQLTESSVSTGRPDGGAVLRGAASGL